jgi:hypothetical protein
VTCHTANVVRRRLVALALLVAVATPAAPAVAAPKKKAPSTTTTVAARPPVTWQLGASGWAPSGAAPKCPAPLRLTLPVDLTKVTAVLYPGQTRGGNYKPHGGFRFDGTPNLAIQVRAPLAGSIVRGARYLAEGELQYTFDVIHPCGIMVRVGHLLSLPKDLLAIAARFPPATTDSRTSWVNPPVPIAVGQVVGIGVGIKASTNTFVDLGVYDLRGTNAASRDPAWRTAHANDRELGWHAVCWLDLLAPDVATRLRALPPGDPTSGKRSDFCR